MFDVQAYAVKRCGRLAKQIDGVFCHGDPNSPLDFRLKDCIVDALHAGDCMYLQENRVERIARPKPRSDGPESPTLARAKQPGPQTLSLMHPLAATKPPGLHVRPGWREEAKPEPDAAAIMAAPASPAAVVSSVTVEEIVQED